MATREGCVNVTDFVVARLPMIREELSNTIYDLDVLKKSGYSVKGGKVFAHIGSKIADSLEEAFAILKLKPRVLRPVEIYLTDDRRNLTNKDRVAEIDGLFFFADNLSVEEEG